MPRGGARSRAAKPQAPKPKRLKRERVSTSKDGQGDGGIDDRGNHANPPNIVDDDDGEPRGETVDVKDREGSESQVVASPLKKTKSARMTIKALQEFVEATEKEEELAGAFERMVREEESRLVGMVERFDQELKSEEEKFEAEFAELLHAALAPTGTENAKHPIHSKNSDTTEPIHLDVSAEKHPLYVSSQELLERTQSMLKDCKKYQKKAKKLDLPESPNRAWEQDKAEAIRIICAAKKEATAEVENLLADVENDGKGSSNNKTRRSRKGSGSRGGGGGGGGAGSDGPLSDDVQLRQTLKAGRQAVDKEYGRKKMHGWGKMASRVEGAMGELVKALPSDAE